VTPAVRVLRWVPAAAQAALIFVLSAQPDLHLADEPLLDFVLHKAAHLAAYAILATLVGWAVGLRGARASRAWGVPLLLCIAYAATDEIHQGFVQGRHPSPADVGIDTLGAIAGLAVYTLIVRNWPWRRPV
jgi:VanZ family protein